MSPHISFRHIDFSPSEKGVRIRVWTDIPCHIWLRLSSQQPWIHKKPSLRRGIQFAEDVRFCFTVYEDNEQFESGDTTLHTFWKENWPICTTKWFYLWGYVSAVLAPSTSPVFKYHNDGVSPVPVPTTLYTFNPIDPEYLNVVPGLVWRTYDLSPYVDADATGVIIYYGWDVNMGLIHWKWRMNGQTFDHDGKIQTPCQGCLIVGLDADKKIQLYTNVTVNAEFFIIGYTGRNVFFFPEPIDVSPTLNQTWTTKELTGLPPNTNAIIGEQANYAACLAFRSDVRCNGSTDNYLFGSDHNMWCIGCDANQRIQTWVWQAGLLQKHYALGYIVGDSSFYVNRRVLAPPPPGVWTSSNVKQDLAAPIYGLLHYGDLSTTCKFGVKKKWGYFNPYISGRGQSYWPIHCLPDGSVEIIRQNANGKFYVTGETE